MPAVSANSERIATIAADAAAKTAAFLAEMDAKYGRQGFNAKAQRREDAPVETGTLNEGDAAE